MEVLTSSSQERAESKRIEAAINQICGQDSHLTAALVERFAQARDIPELREALRALEQEIHQGYAAALESFSSK